MKLLIIRPQPGNDASASRALEAGFEPVQLPFFEVRARAWNAPPVAQFDSLLITSANAIRHAGAGLEAFTALPVHAVVQNSAAAVTAAGLMLASVGTMGVDEALQQAKAAGHHHLLWLAGARIRPISIAPPGMQIETQHHLFFRTCRTTRRCGNGHHCQCGYCCAPFGPRSTRFAELVDSSRLSRDDIWIAAFSSAIAQAAGPGWRGIAIAERPDDQALLSAAHTLVKQAHNQGRKGTGFELASRRCTVDIGICRWRIGSKLAVDIGAFAMGGSCAFGSGSARRTDARNCSATG
jgi:uroporphyrinogen-III synthase